MNKVSMHLTVALAVFACAGPPLPPTTLAILDVQVLPMDDETVLDNQMVLIHEDQIVAVVPAERRRVPAGARVVEGNGRYVIPGLWDMHVHAISDPDDAIARTLPLFLAHGVTGVRDMGSTLEALVETRKRLADDERVLAPRLVAAGPLLDGTRKPWYRDLPLILESPEDVRAELTRLRDAGVGFFKVYDDLAPGTYQAIAEAAEELAMPFAGHPPTTVGWTAAATAGQHSVEHLGLPALKDCIDDYDTWFSRSIGARFGEGYDAYYRVLEQAWEAIDWQRCDAMLQALADHDVYFTPTLGMEINDRGRVDLDAIEGMLPQSRDWCRTTLDGIDQADPELREAVYARLGSTLRRAKDAGVVLLAGSDSENYCLAPGAGLQTELALLVEAGLTPYEALRAATRDAAEAVGFGDRSGRVAPGYWADLVLLEANPLEDVTRTRTIAGLVAAGRWIDSSELESIRAQALAVADRAETP